MSVITHAVSDVFLAQANTTPEAYQHDYHDSLNNTDAFWRKEAQCVDWIKPFTTVQDTSFHAENFGVSWFKDGELNVSANCLDRHAETQPNKVALIWEGDDPTQRQTFTFLELKQNVCQFANVLLSQGVKKGDRVTIYLPMIPEASIAMLACTRIGAVHSVIFAGFSPESIAGRLKDCGSSLVITADEGVRGGKSIPLKKNVDLAIALAEPEQIVTDVIVVKRTGAEVNWTDTRDYWYADLMQNASIDCPAVAMNAEDPLFILYTSGSTGKPKGVLHTTGGYLVYVTSTFKHMFDLKDNDVFWCTADVGWITGHSYLLYGALSNGTTTVMFEGVPQYPTWARFGQVIDQHHITILYTAPTAIRSLMREGDDFVHQSSRQSLRLLGSVGEPINPEAWEWYYTVYGDARCPIIDTWWQTETGGALITPIPASVNMKAGSAMNPFYGIRPAIVDVEGNILEGECEGNLVILDSWPAQMRTVYGDHQRFFETYFSTYAGMYFTGDGAKRDADGHYWITGRVDDVLNVSGHRIGTAEVESALVGHDDVAEAGVVGIPHDIKGQGIVAFVTLNHDAIENSSREKQLKDWVRQEIGAIATLEAIYIVNALPKTRSGKIMRRILRKIACHDTENLGDLSSLLDPSVVDLIIQQVGH